MPSFNSYNFLQTLFTTVINLKEKKLIARLRLGLKHLREYKFKQFSRFYRLISKEKTYKQFDQLIFNFVDKLCHFYKVFKNEHPKYLSTFFNNSCKKYIIPSVSYTTRNTNNIPLLHTKHGFFKNFFLPPTTLTGTT